MPHAGRLALTLLLLLLSLREAPAQTDQRVALVIGNGGYLNAGELKNPPNDAKAMAAMLRRSGFDVMERENATRRQMIEATRTFGEKLSPGGVGLFFYAGHGIQARGANYLLPIDVALAAEDDLKYEAIDVQDILNKLDDAKVRLSLIILDACRDNPFVRSFRSTARGLAQIDAPRGTLIAYATAPGKLAADGDGGNGVYTSELLNAMSQPGLKLQDVFEQVIDAVERRTANAQTPWISSSFRGDFYFVPPLPQGAMPPGEGGRVVQSPEIVFWQSVANSRNPADYDAYVQQFPNGTFVPLAHARIASLAMAPVPSKVAPAAAADESAWSESGRRATQTALASLGFYQGPINGNLARDSQAAVRVWQSFNGAEETGLLTAAQRDQISQQADRQAAILTVSPTSPGGLAADRVKSAKERFNLGADYERGDGHAKDTREAAYWYSLAAAEGWPAAFTNLGTLYARGFGVAGPDFDTARRLWLTAAALGNKTALFNLGALAEKGIDGSADLVGAKRWYALGAKQDDPGSKAALKRLER